MIPKPQRLFLILSAIFLGNALIAEFIGVKIFSLERTLGVQPVAFTLFGEGPLSLALSTGVLLWPLVFVTSDLINEYFGLRAVRFLSWLAAGVIAYAFVMVGLAILLPPADFWLWNKVEGRAVYMPDAFYAVFAQSLWIVVGSITAFLLGQLVDVVAFTGCGASQKGAG